MRPQHSLLLLLLLELAGFTRISPLPSHSSPSFPLPRARALAREQGDLALAALSCLPDTPSKRSLELMVDLVLERLY